MDINNIFFTERTHYLRNNSCKLCQKILTLLKINNDNITLKN